MNILGNRSGSDKADRLNLGVVQDAVNNWLVPLNYIENSVRQTSFLQKLRNHDGNARITLAGLQKKRISARNRYRKHPHRNHCRKVERRNSSHNAEWLTHRPAIDTRPYRL